MYPRAPGCSTARDTRRCSAEAHEFARPGPVCAAAHRTPSGGPGADAAGGRRRVTGRAGGRGGAVEHPPDPPAGSAGGRNRAGVPRTAACDRGQESSGPVLSRDGLLRLHHAGRHSSQRAGESFLVHALHTVSGGDRPGSSGSTPELPDDGQRPDRDGGGERVAARRGDGGRRGDGDAASHQFAAGQSLPGVGTLLSADPHRRTGTRRAARDEGRGWRRHDGGPAGRPVRLARAVSG